MDGVGCLLAVVVIMRADITRAKEICLRYSSAGLLDDWPGMGKACMLLRSLFSYIVQRADLARISFLSSLVLCASLIRFCRFGKRYRGFSRYNY